jgi:hypothetical protein
MVVVRYQTDTGLFWYFYSLACYEHKVFSGIGLTLHHNHQEEYLKVTFGHRWRGSYQWWFHANLGEAPQRVNKHLLLPLNKNKRKVPEEMRWLKALVRRVTELHRARLEACHYAKEFMLR